jgi:hypothetical protein
LNVTCAAQLDVRETADSTTSPSSGAGGDQRIYNQYSSNVTLKSDSFPPISGQAVDLSHTLSGGTTKDFDLTAAPWAGDISKTVDKTTKKIVGIILRFLTTNNAAGVTFGPQGANGHALFGAAVVPRFYPGDQVVLFSADPDQATALTVNRPAVAAGSKDLRFTGTDGDGWKCLLIFNG